MFPGQPWLGHGSLGRVTKALDAVIAYCFTHRLPVITVLIVNSANRQLSEDAKDNIYRVCREMGFQTGPIRDVFIDQQMALSLGIRNRDLPAT